MNFLRHYIRFESKEMIGKFDQEVALITNNDYKNMEIDEFLLDRAKKEGLKEGREESMAKAKRSIQKLLFLKTLTVEQIAETLEVSVDFVSAIKRDLEQR